MRGRRLVIPTAAEILRIKAWLALSRNQTRDYLDIAALKAKVAPTTDVLSRLGHVAGTSPGASGP